MWSEKRVKEEIESNRKYCLLRLEELQSSLNEAIETTKSLGILNEDEKDNQYGFNFQHLKILTENLKRVDFHMNEISMLQRILEVNQ